MEDNAIKLKYGIRNGMVVSIDELSVMDRGLRCHCVCPGCGQELQARIGTGKRQPHFAHNNTSCDIHSAHQTALHLMAKEIIEQEKKIKLPPIFVKLHDIASELGDYDGYTLPDAVEAIAGTIVDCDRVIVEKRLSSIVPDLIIETHGKQLLVEIAVTHFVDEEKQIRVRQLGIPMIEINLRSLVNEQCSRSDLKKILINQLDCKYWIYTPKENEARIRGIEKYKQLMRNQKSGVEREKRKRAESLRKKQLEERAKNYINDLKQPNNYREAIVRLRDDDAYTKALHSRTFYRDGVDLPHFMDIPINGEMVFECDRRIWQSAIFDKFIYNRNPENSLQVNVSRITSWLYKHQHDIHINDILEHAVVNRNNNPFQQQRLLSACIAQYLAWMEYIGFLSDSVVQSVHSIVPPNQKASENLRVAIQSVDEYCWDVTRQLHEHLHSIRRAELQKKKQAEITEKVQNSVNITPSVQVERTNRYAYNEGYQEIVISGLFDSMELPPKDQYGHRWKRCKVCELIKRDDEMASYQGKYGLCEECAKAKRSDD